MTISSMSLGMKRNRDDVFEEKRQKTVSYAEDTHFQYMATTKSSTLAGNFSWIIYEINSTVKFMTIKKQFMHIW